jgi:glycosyltransferase involved in cell wall biosynthesis
MENPRVLIAIATFHPIVGGAERQALAQGRSLRQKGLEATIITFRHSRSWAARDTMDGVPIIRIAGLFLGRREKLPRALQKLLYFVAMLMMGWAVWRYRHCYDVLHVYQLNVLALPTALACYLSGKPMIIAIRCADAGKKASTRSRLQPIVGPLEVSSAVLLVDGDARVEGDLKDLERLGRPVKRFTRYLLERNHAVVIILSSRMRDYLAAHDFALPETRLIPNGVDLARFTPTGNDISRELRSQTVICTARLSYQKGIDVLLQAWNLVCKELPEALLIIAGTGPMQTQLAYLARALGIEERVEFVGLQSDVASLLHKAGIATLPSRWEGMPNAVLEAMACGIPCVATRVSGSEDIIEHGVNGLLVEPEDYQELAQALLLLLCDPELARKYGEAARGTVEQNYSLEHLTDVYLELYRQMAGQFVDAVTRSRKSRELQLL